MTTSTAQGEGRTRLLRRWKPRPQETQWWQPMGRSSLSQSIIHHQHATTILATARRPYHRPTRLQQLPSFSSKFLIQETWRWVLFFDWFLSLYVFFFLLLFKIFISNPRRSTSSRLPGLLLCWWGEFLMRPRAPLNKARDLEESPTKQNKERDEGKDKRAKGEKKRRIREKFKKPSNGGKRK